MKDAYTILEDKTMLDIKERIVFFSVKRFISDIALGDCCFICGASPSDKEFNDEHVIPDWVLRKYKAKYRNITLPNRKNIHFPQYKIPCCNDCNTMLGNKIEKPIRKIISRGYDNFIKNVSTSEVELIIKWLSLIFVKVHLKDKQYRLLLDNRKPNYKISELYDLESLHHIHCIARSLYTNCPIDSKVFGSLVVLPVKIKNELDQFDYADIFYGKGILIRLGEICLVAILNDSCGSLILFQENLNKIKGFLNPIQPREVLVRLSHINFNLKERPIYYTELNPQKGPFIKVKIPEMVKFEDKKVYSYADFFYAGCHDIISLLKHHSKKFIEEKVKEGTWSFLFDKRGNFIKDEN